MDPIRKIPMKVTKKFVNKVINIQYFHRKTGLDMYFFRVWNFKKGPKYGLQKAGCKKQGHCHSKSEEAWLPFLFLSENDSGLPKAELFGRSRSFLLFGLRLRLPKFYSKYSAFDFVLRMDHYPFFSSLKADRLKGC